MADGGSKARLDDDSIFTVCKSWTVETAMTHLLALVNGLEQRTEDRFEASKDAVTAAIAAADRAVQKAESAAEKRFESVNEFRSTLADQQRNLMLRAEAVALVDSIKDKVSSLEKQLDQQRDERRGERTGMQNLWGYAVGVIGMLLAAGALITRFTGKP
jgi:ribosomal protein L12E/L44/L45/RPP1/RPP2